MKKLDVWAQLHKYKASTITEYRVNDHPLCKVSEDIVIPVEDWNEWLACAIEDGTTVIVRAEAMSDYS